MIIRNIYINKLKDLLDKPIIKVITGLRRSGKTTIIKQFVEFLDPNKYNIIYIDKEDLEFDNIKDYKILYEYIKNKESNIKKNIIIIDEIQYISEREKTIASFGAKSNIYDIYISGSNSQMLSGELATNIAGRYISIYIQPLGFDEFVDYYGSKLVSQDKIDSLFLRYIKQGGLPGLLFFEDNIKNQQEYLIGLKNTIIIKDIIDRFAIRNIVQLQNLLVFLADNIGNLFSAKKISDYLKSQKINLNISTIQDYLYYISSVYLISQVPRYDIKGKKILEIGEKRYFNDLGLRNILINWKDDDIGFILENVVYIELIRRGYTVYIGANSNKEIDFVAIGSGGEIEYYQVCYLLKDQDTIDREFGNLENINDNYPKFVITMDKISNSNRKGIQRIYITDWLLGKHTLSTL